jgi:hypothetical protein
LSLLQRHGYLTDRAAEQAGEFSYGWYIRLVELRKRGLVGAIYSEGGNWSLATNQFCPYGSRKCYSVAKLKDLIVSLEDQPRKICPPPSELLEEFRLFNNLAHLPEVA